MTRRASGESSDAAFRMMAGETDEARRIAMETYKKARATGNQTDLESADDLAELVAQQKAEGIAAAQELNGLASSLDPKS